MDALKKLTRFWMTFESPVARADYLRHGVGLMILKYGVDAGVIAMATGALWTPADYLQSVPLLVATRLTGAPNYLAPLLAAWTLPFLWIGITMTIRRLLDAGFSAWWSLLFFVPFVNYGLMGGLAAVPQSKQGRKVEPAPEPDGQRIPQALVSIGVGGLTGLLLLWLGVAWLESYGMSLFMGTPFVIGITTGFVLCRRYPASGMETAEVVALTVLLVAGAAFALGVEGAVCLLMIAPLGIVLAIMGGVVGRYLANAGQSPVKGAALVAVLLPSGLATEAGPDFGALREVRSAVEIDAPPEVVWDMVVEFPPLPEPEQWMFRMGIAYPVRAEIRGAGVGAIRYCVFSTGPFVEPITAWEPGRRLSFDVVESPRPLEEFSFLNASPPHLTGYLAPRRGEFRLIPLPGGRTRLEGSTWYDQKLRPEGYWVVFSDYVISEIHDQVLRHIKRVSEEPPPAQPR